MRDVILQAHSLVWVRDYTYVGKKDFRNEDNPAYLLGCNSFHAAFHIIYYHFVTSLHVDNNVLVNSHFRLKLNKSLAYMDLHEQLVYTYNEPVYSHTFLVSSNLF